MNILFVWPKPPELFLEKPLTFSVLSSLTPKKHNIEIIEGEYNDVDFDKNYDLVGDRKSVV